MNATAIRAVAVIAAIYGYFLIFAQFAFVELIRLDFTARSASSFAGEKIALGAMAVAGIAAGFLVAWKGATPGKIRIGLGIAALASLVAPFGHGVVPFTAVAILTGAALGISTVSLATLVRSWCGLLAVGIGTGIGYACCNLPPVFLQSPAHQAWIATAFATIGLICVPSVQIKSAGQTGRVFPFPSAVLLFTALVWLDSAAFFIIQHSVDLKSGTWGDALLWRNAAIHLIMAIAAGVWLSSDRARSLPAIAWVILSIAAIAVNHESSRPLAGWVYPAAVSLYSAALVTWPGWFSGASGNHAVGWRAAWLYAVAGWFGSANGIGMVQTLKRVPPEFIAITGLIVFSVMFFPVLKNWRVSAAIAAIVGIALWPRPTRETAVMTPADRGRQVYLSEGCIHCHSQYVRPGSRDEEYWIPNDGYQPATGPVLIGNRRQGPDLSTVGARRSASWLKQHFIDPRAFAPSSPMPSYAYLFEDGRGDDLIQYLQQNGGAKIPDLLAKAASWSAKEVPASSDARSLFSTQCAVCHGDGGRGDGQMAPHLTRPPVNLVDGPFVWSPASEDQVRKIRRIIKFGLPGTDMPGHELLSDGQVIALADHILNLRHPGNGR